MQVVSVSGARAQPWATSVTEDYFGTVVKSGVSRKGVHANYSTQNGELLEYINHTTLSLEAINIGSIRFPGGTESRYFRLSNSEDIAGLHRAINYCAEQGLKFNFTLHDTRYFKDVSKQEFFLTDSERAELSHFIEVDLIGYAKEKGVEIESIHIGNEFQGRTSEYGVPAWVGYAKSCSVLINELDRIFDANPSLETARPDFVIQPNNWESQSTQDAFVKILKSHIGIDGDTAAAKVDAIDIHGVGTGARTSTDTLELTWEDYFGTGPIAAYEENIARIVNYWRNDPRFGEIGFRNDAWAYADSPNLKDAALGMLQIHTASEYGFESMTNYLGYGPDASALTRQVNDQSSTMVNMTAGGALYEMMTKALVGTKAITLNDELAPAQEALQPVLLRAFEGDDRIVLYLVNRTGEAMDIDLVAKELLAGNADFQGNLAPASIQVLGSQDPTSGAGVPTSRAVELEPSALELGQTDFTLQAYEIAQVIFVAPQQIPQIPAEGAAAPILAEEIVFDPEQGQLTHDSDDNLFFGGGTVRNFIGGAGDDTVSYELALGAVSANLSSLANKSTGAPHDTYQSIENLIGSDFDDTITGNRFANALYGGAGNDTFFETEGNDTIFGGQGYEDTLILNQKSTFLSLHSGDNNKGLSISGIENIVAGSGNDSITGNFESNKISGRSGDDFISGFGGDDILSGNGGRDKIYGGKGADTIIGGRGADVLFGGEGRNTFLYFTSEEGGDKIKDFKTDPENGDVFSLRASSFGNLDIGKLQDINFVTREKDNHAQDADDRFVFQESTSQLWYDMDGAGQLPPNLLAELDGDDSEDGPSFSSALIWLF